jgi:hypothetical protein
LTFPVLIYTTDFSVNPGLCKTELSRENESWGLTLMIALISRTSEMGSRTLTHAAIGSNGENFKGEYLSDCKVDTYNPSPPHLPVVFYSRPPFLPRFSMSSATAPVLSFHHVVRKTDGRMSPFVLSEKGKETGKKVWREMMDVLRGVAPEVDKVF